MELVAPHRIDELVARAERLLAALTPSGSRYRDLVQVARAYQEMGNALASLLYERSAAKTACARGCDTCCHILSAVAGFHPDNTFGMNVLEPFVALVSEIAPQIPFRGDFLEILEEVAMFDKHALFGTLRMKVDTQELDTWRPFALEPLSTELASDSPVSA